MITYVVTNNGRIVAPHPNLLRMKAASGATVTCTTANIDYTQTVTPGALYKIVGGPDTGTNMGEIYLSTTGVITTAANIEMACLFHCPVVIEIPVGVTTLHVGASANNTYVYLAQVDV